MSKALSDVETGERFQITEVPDGKVRAQLLRIGFLDGIWSAAPTSGTALSSWRQTEPRSPSGRVWPTRSP